MYRKIVLAALAVICCQLGVKAEELSPRQMKSILVAANAWTGTPYRFAGKDRGGVDCSHFVYAAYSRVLPDYKYRMAEDYLNDPQFSQTPDPHPGDIIVFTAVNGMSAHVGIVTDPEERKFIGSQSSTGVKETSYAAKTYWGKRPYRFLSLNARSQAIANRPKGQAGGDRVASPGANRGHLKSTKSKSDSDVVSSRNSAFRDRVEPKVAKGKPALDRLDSQEPRTESIAYRIHVPAPKSKIIPNRGHDQDLRSQVSNDRVKVEKSRSESVVSRLDAKSPRAIAIADYTGQTFNVLPLDRE